MIKHASSHGFSVFMCTITASFLVEILKPLIPGLMTRIKNLSQFLIELLAIPLTTEFLTIIILASFMAVVWGIFFKIRYDGRKG